MPLTSEHAEQPNRLPMYYLPGARARISSLFLPFSPSFLSTREHTPLLVNPELCLRLAFSEQVLKYLALRASLNRAAITRPK